MPKPVEPHLPGLGPEGGYRSKLVTAIVGITYRQLDHWTKTGLVRASVQEGAGSGAVRLYSFVDIVQLRMIKALLDAGMSLTRVRRALQLVAASQIPLPSLILASDGETVHAMDNTNQVMDLLRGGQGVFAMMVEPLWRSTRADVAHLPAEQPVVAVTA